MRARQLLTPAAIAAGTFLFFCSPAAADDLTGDDGDNSIDGTDGNDTVSGLGGEDHLHGEEGNDTVLGGEGDDIASGGSGDDIVDGGPGDDSVVGDGEIDGEDICFLGGDGPDPDSCPGDDTVSGGEGDDTVIGDGALCVTDLFNDASVAAAEVADDCAGDDVVNGGPGDDIVIGDGSQNLFCLLGNDGFGTLFGGFGECLPGGDDELTGGDGDDLLDGGLGDDQLDGGDGDDILFGDAFLSLLVGLGELPPDVAAAMIDSLRQQLAAAAIDEELREQLEMELLFFSLLLPGDDDELTGGAGDDALFGLGGNDALCGDADDSYVLGGTGADIPCPVDGTVEVIAGTPVSGSVAPVRGLDDEDLEVDEDGNPNPFFYVVVVAPTQGTLVVNPDGSYTYTPFENASGSDSFQIAIRRLIPDCQNLEVALDGFEVGAASFDEICSEWNEVQAVAVVTIGEDDFVEKVATINVTITPLAVDPPVDAPAAVAPLVAQQAPAELPHTGSMATRTAVGGMVLVALGLLAQAEADRRRRQLSYAARRHAAG